MAIVYVDRDSYTDSADGVVSFVDAIYYSTVTITTTGYGDITPVTPHARLINSVIIAPLRVIFLVLLVGTTLQVLANEGRRIFRDNRWRRHMRNHVVVIGYGTKGRAAVGTLVDNGASPSQVVIIDNRPASISEANLKGYAAIEGDAHPPRDPATGRDHQGPRGGDHSRPRRLRDPGHPDRPAVQSECACRGRGPRGRQRAAAAAVRARTR